MDIEVDITDQLIETDRLILRAWKEDDLQYFFDYASVEGVGEMAGWRHHDCIATTQKILQSFIKEKNVFAIVSKQDHKVIGSLGLHYSWANTDENYKFMKVKEIGYVLSKAHWGNGYMPEAVNAIIAFCFKKYELDAVTCGHFIHNAQSQRVIEKCGFTFVLEDTFFAEQLQETFCDRKYIRKRF